MLGKIEIPKKDIGLLKERFFEFGGESLIVKTAPDRVYKIYKDYIPRDTVENKTKKIEKIEEMGYGNLPICIAKTQYSFSDDAKNLECDEPFEINVRDVELKAGAGFIVVLAGKIMTMPGLPKSPAAERIDVDAQGVVSGLF